MKKIMLYSELTKEELIKKCENQKLNIKQLENSLKIANSRINVLQTITSEMNIYDKLNVCMQETLSYMEEVEELKKQTNK
ncbi:MAG: hypothetical protein M0R51_09415 [Clostridia bacterium]|jgi:hypothetical protein|nr:hypothetical protein [Clostridia bacterium]